MNKVELVSEIAKVTNMSKKDTEVFVEAFIRTVTDSVVSGDAVKLVGFGSFEPKSRAARAGRNPKTKEAIDIPASRSVGFKVGKGFKDALNT